SIGSGRQKTTQPSIVTVNGQKQHQTRRGRTSIIAATILGGVIAVGTGMSITLWLTRPQGPTSASAQKDAPPPAKHSAPAPIRWSISSLPPGAEVRRVQDGAILGKTPWQLERSPESGVEELFIVAPGYQLQKLSLRRDRDSDHSLLLVAAPPAASLSAPS